MPTEQLLITRSTIVFKSQTRQARLRQFVESTVEASFSTSLTMAGFLLEHYKGIRPPKFEGPISENDDGESEQTEGNSTFDKMYEPWSDYLADLFLRNKVRKNGDVCQFTDEVGDEFIDQLGEDLFAIQAIFKPSTQQFQPIQTHQTPLPQQALPRPTLTPQPPTSSTKKIAIINFATSQLRTDPIRPKMHLVGLFAGIFFNQGDEWKLYNVLKQEYPTREEYMELDTVILSGSSLSVNDETPEVLEFVKTLKQAIKLNPKLKILGVCFGHQALAKMFGGTIVQKHLQAGVQPITFNPTLTQSLPYFQPTTPSTFSLSEYHKDFVVQVPQNFDILAQSQSCTIESLVSHNKKYLSFQFHPEYSAEYIKSFEMRMEKYSEEGVDSPYCRGEIGSVRHQQSLWEIRRIIRKFIDWEVEEE